jgi:non-heme chloroperoxidase
MKLLYICILSVAGFFHTCEAAVQIAEDFVTGADHNRIHYLSAGHAEARHTLLFIPGWRVSATIWSKQLEFFAQKGYRVIAIDSRSQGDSSIVQFGNSPEDRAADIEQVIKKLHLSHLTLAGWSQGAQDVAAYVERFGTGAIENLAMIDSPVSAGPDDVGEHAPFVKIILAAISGYAMDPKTYSEGMMHSIISTPACAEAFKVLVDKSLNTPVDIGISMLVQDLFTIDRRPALRKFDKPTLIVASDQSRLLDAQKQMAATLAKGSFVVFDHAAHAVFFDQPEKFNLLIHRLISGKAVGDAPT